MRNELTIVSEARLRQWYRPATQRSLDKEINHLDTHCRDFIAHAPFAVLASAASTGQVAVSPRGGPPGFVAVLDDHRLAIPDMAGNNRLDSMHNIIRGGRVALLFMVPGIDETLRVSGTASVSVGDEVLDRCPVEGLASHTAIVVKVATAFIQCAKALRRAAIWHHGDWPDVTDMATPACMLKDHIGLATVGESQRFLDDSYATTTWAMGGGGQGDGPFPSADQR